MRRNIILIPPWETYGDTFSVVGLYYFLLRYYERVHLYLFNNPSLNSYFSCYFSNETLFGKNLFICNDPVKLIDSGDYGDYDICNTLTAAWDKPQFDFFDLEKVDKNYYFNDLNPLYNKLNIEENYIKNPNKHLPNLELSINHIFYYELLGLNNNVRMDYFDYKRNLEQESLLKNNILKSRGIVGGYNIVNDPIGANLGNIITNGLPIINISDLATCVGQLTMLVESAEEIHFVEGNNVNFFYHCDYKKIFKYHKKINFHVKLRNRDWKITNMMLDSAWKMMNEPKLENWNFIF